MGDEKFGLWGETAEPAPATLPLPGDCEIDVVIVGAGYTGLSTALHLATNGTGVVCLDAEQPGFGASGRNGGQVVPGFKTYPDDLIARYGVERGGAMVNFGARMADDLFALVAEHGIACDARRSGWIHAGHHPSKLPEQRWKHDQWAARGESVAWLDAQAIAERLGSEVYVGGWIDERGGTVHPLSLARGLARAAIASGARIHGETRVTRIARDADGWRVETDRGRIRARIVVVATNGYTARLVPKLAGTVVAVESAQIATEPLPPEVLSRILPGLACVSDTRRSILYYRRTHDGRLVMGGRGGILLDTGPDRYKRLVTAAKSIYPQLAAFSWTHRWAGKLAVTLDHIPHLHESSPGLIASLGCNGRGVAYSCAIGRVIAQRIASGDWSSAPLPVSSITPMPMAPFRRLGAAMVAGWYEWRDGRSA